MRLTLSLRLCSVFAYPKSLNDAGMDLGADGMPKVPDCVVC